MSQQHGRGRRTFSAFHAPFDERLAVTAAAVVLFAAALLPIGTVLASARIDNSDGHALLRAVGDLAASGALLARSACLASAVTAIALGLGIPLGVLLAKTDVPSRRVGLLLHAFPMFLPPFLLALGWFYLFGRGSMFSSEVTSRLLFSPAGAVVVMALAFTPVVTALTMLGLSGVDPSLEEAALLVAPPRRVITRILLPAAWPALALAGIVVFTLAFSELGVPMFLRVRVYPAAVFSRLAGASFSPGEAALLVLPLLVIAIALLALERTFVGRRSFAVLGLRREAMPRASLSRGRGIPAVGLWAFVAVGLMPIVGLLLEASDGGFALAPRWMGSAVPN